MTKRLLWSLATGLLALGCSQTITLPSPSSNGSGTGSPTSSISSTSSAASSGTGAAPTTGSAAAGSSTGAPTTSSSSGSTSGGTAGLAAGAPCSSDASCASQTCGSDGTGHCCLTKCSSTDSACAAADCDNTGACAYAADTVACGEDAGSCSNDIQTGTGFCDAKGNCESTKACAPFICGATACLTSCTDATSCVAGDFCDAATSSCCAAFSNDGNTLSVDSAIGNDKVPCCGIGGNQACQTLTRAMQLIDSSQTPGVTIFAAVDAGEGDWLPPGEVYPVVLGWGTELIAPAIYFFDPAAAVPNPAIFDVAAYSTSDTVGYASIASLAGAATGIGMNQAGTQQSIDQVSIQIEPGKTLYLANVNVNGSAANRTTAIEVGAGATLMVGEDQSTAVIGTVQIGNDLGAVATDGWKGIECESAKGQGCSVKDAPVAGQNSLIVQGQESEDIGAGDGADLTLTSAPILGIPPTASGFGECSSKSDASSSHGSAVALIGSAKMDFENGTVQCIAGAGFSLNPSSAGGPTLKLVATTVQNTDDAILANAGSVTAADCTIQFNYNGVIASGTVLADGGVENATVDLSGDGADAGPNAIVCCSEQESSVGATTSGVCVLNGTSASLDADDVAWDTNSPDLFSCTDSMLSACTCEVASCTDSPGADGMDAVDDSTGTITTTGNTLSGINCQPTQGTVCKPACTAGLQCCATTPNKGFCHAAPCPP